MSDVLYCERGAALSQREYERHRRELNHDNGLCKRHGWNPARYADGRCKACRKESNHRYQVNRKTKEPHHVRD